jgi:hypothetical protein
MGLTADEHEMSQIHDAMRKLARSGNRIVTLTSRTEGSKQIALAVYSVGCDAPIA